MSFGNIIGYVLSVLPPGSRSVSKKHLSKGNSGHPILFYPILSMPGHNA